MFSFWTWLTTTWGTLILTLPLKAEFTRSLDSLAISIVLRQLQIPA